MKYYINNEEVEVNKFYFELEEAIYRENAHQFDDMLDECYPLFEMGNLVFYPSTILNELDPIAYKIEKDSWIDSIQTDTNTELEKGEVCTIDDKDFFIKDNS